MFRKLVYRRVVMKRYGVVAGESVAPPGAAPLEIAFLDEAQFDEVLGSSPYLTVEDLTRFRANDSVCIVAKDGERIVATSWMTRGTVYVTELQRTVEVPETDHFSCRSYVAPEYRGLRLLSHMIHQYADRIADAEDEVWGLVYAWNVASIRSLERIGWRYRGELDTTTLFGCRITRAHRPARSATASERRARSQA